MKKASHYALAAVLAGLAANAYAHPGHSAYSGLLAGFAHPLSGTDHLLAMFAVGIWAAQLGGRALWAVPLAFVSVMTIGAAAAMTAHAGIGAGAIESGVAASLLALGLLVFRAQRLPLAAAVALVGLFAWFHGAAHARKCRSAALRDRLPRRDRVAAWRGHRLRHTGAAPCAATRPSRRSGNGDHGHGRVDRRDIAGNQSEQAARATGVWQRTRRRR
ncbi:HupE/UreJ family protein [Rudaea sp.]|uniref:HupE/UreJ family protein n=1 Tax=Rudaea sp. TaxID=2136325 RepID=UPI003BEEE361